MIHAKFPWRIPPPRGHHANNILYILLLHRTAMNTRTIFLNTLLMHVISLARLNNKQNQESDVTISRNDGDTEDSNTWQNSEHFVSIQHIFVLTQCNKNGLKARPKERLRRAKWIDVINAPHKYQTSHTYIVCVRLHSTTSQMDKCLYLAAHCNENNCFHHTPKI